MKDGGVLAALVRMGRPALPAEVAAEREVRRAGGGRYVPAARRGRGGGGGGG